MFVGTLNQDGKSAYELWLDEGNTGTIQDFFDAMRGQDGNAGTTGPTGPAGPPGNDGVDGSDGQGVPTGGTAGQVLKKIDGTDYNTEWADDNTGSGSFDLKPFCITGSGTDLTTSATTIALTSTAVSNLNYIVAASLVTVSASGTYLIAYALDMNEDSVNGSTRRKCSAWVENGSTEISGSRMSTYTREASGGSGISNCFICTLPSTSVLRLRSQMDAAGPDFSVNVSQLSIMKLA